MNNKEHTKLEGKCPCCEKNVYSNQLFVEENSEVYHLSCYNENADDGDE